MKAAGDDLLQKHQLQRDDQHGQLFQVEDGDLLERVDVGAEAFFGELILRGFKKFFGHRQRARRYRFGWSADVRNGFETLQSVGGVLYSGVNQADVVAQPAEIIGDIFFGAVFVQAFDQRLEFRNRCVEAIGGFGGRRSVRQPGKIGRGA